MARHNKIRLMIGTLVAVLSVGAIAAGVAFAQSPTGQAGATGHPRMMGGAGPMGHGTMMFRRGLAQLNLTDDQKAQVKGIMQGHKAQMQGLGTQVRDARRQLADAVASGADEATIRTKADALGKVQGDVAVFGATLRKEIFGVLTPDQREKAKTLRLEALDRIDRFQGKKKGGRGF